MSPRLKSSLVVFLLLASAGAVCGQEGLKGEYFANMTLAGQPALTRTEAVNFNWGGASPGDPIGVDAFSVRWTGSLTPPESGSYTFGTRTDDGVRLWVGGELIVNNWGDHSATMNRGQPIQLEAGEPVAITLEYYENGGDAVCELYWSGPGHRGRDDPGGIPLADHRGRSQGSQAQSGQRHRERERSPARMDRRRDGDVPQRLLRHQPGSDRGRPRGDSSRPCPSRSTTTSRA